MKRGPVHVPVLMAAYSVSSLAGHTSLLTYLMYALLLYLPILRSWVSEAPLSAASDTDPMQKLCGVRPVVSYPALSKHQLSESLTSLASTCLPNHHTKRGPVHVPCLMAAYSVSSLAGHTSLLVSRSILVTGVQPLWYLKKTKVTATLSDPRQTF